MTTTDAVDMNVSAPELTEQQAVEQLAAEGAAAVDRPQRFTRPGPVTSHEQDMRELFEQREDDPPPDVPRDQWDRPIIVTPDGDVRSYVRASSYGCIEDKYGISRWKRGQVVIGMSRAFHLYQRAQSVSGTLTKRDRATIYEIADRAELVAGSDAGSLTGTALHLLSERRDRGDDLSYLDPTTTACLDAYGRLMAPFEVLASEMFVVYDDYGGAGTLDRAVRLRWDLVFADGLVIPAGTIVIIDVKTGKITSVKYWMAEYSCQQFIYDGGVPYFPGVTHLADPKVRSVGNIERVTDQPGNNGRVSWDEVGVPGGPNHDYALILHVPASQPDKARIILVRLGEARLDADVCRDAWARRRVPWADRYAALPASQLVPPDEREGKIKNLEVDNAVSTPAEPAPAEHVNPTLVAALLERIRRAQHPADVQAIWEAWEQSPSWTDEVHNASVDRWDALTPPEDVAACDGCNYDTHRCPGCGTDTPHGVAICAPCSLRLALEDAPDRPAINVLWIAHGPDGDGLWTEEHQAVGIERYRALPATEEWPDLDTEGLADEPEPEQQPETDGGPFQGPDDDPAGPPITSGPLTLAGGMRGMDSVEPPEQPAAYPFTIPGEPEHGFEDEIILWCHECLVPAGHPAADDPIAWCDCPPGETCMDAAVACRNRSHDPDACPHKPEPDSAPECAGCTLVTVDGALVHEIGCTVAGPSCAEHGAHPGTVDCPQCPPAGTEAIDVADLRDMIEEALDTQTVDDLYDRYGPDAGGPWDDDCNARAQAVYDRYGVPEGAQS